MPAIVNIAAYKFLNLSKLRELRAELLDLCKCNELKGTILLSNEGINMFVAGSRDGVDILLAKLKEIPGVWPIEVKESYNQEQPFNRMLVRVKKEIIAFGVDGIDPRKYSSKRITATQLKEWLDAGKPVTLLDTRNNFEIGAGTFKNAVAIGVDDFRHFPQAVRNLPDAMKAQPIVTFCTGGIRCEKAAPYLEKAGFTNVYQLDGGILKYFQDCGGAHYDGQCFVFDKRVALDTALREGGLKQCYACQAILSEEAQKSPLYIPPKHCPQCYETEAESAEKQIAKRQAAITKATSPLPGSAPYINERPMSIPLKFDGVEMIEFLVGMRLHLSREEWLNTLAEGRLLYKDQPVLPGRIVRSGERYIHRIPGTQEPDVASDIHIIFEDNSIVILNKPAPLPAHPCGRFNRNTLSYILDIVYSPLHLRPAHRLDADTSGVVVCSKTSTIARIIQPQFETGEVSKKYFARVYGKPTQIEFECHAPIAAEPGENGVRLPIASGLPSITRFKLIRTLNDGTSLIECTPLTGRTNQIRAHLWKLDLPIVGEAIYLRNQQIGASMTLSTTDAPLCLHAASIEFTHPVTKERVKFNGKTPAWANE